MKTANAQIKIALVGVIVVGLTNSSCGPMAYNVEHIEIDSTLHIRPLGSRSLLEPNQGSYYAFSRGNVISVDHYAKMLGSERRTRFLNLEADPDFRLNRTVKEDEILKGPFGTLYSTKECFYNNSLLEKGYSTVFDGSNGNDDEHEIPTELTAAPKDLPPLTSLSLIRIFWAEPEFTIVSANYERDGSFAGLHVNKAQGGDIEIAIFKDFNMFDLEPPIRAYGIPKRIDIKEYIASRRLTLPRSKFADFADVINEHYGYNKIIRQDKLSHGGAIASRFLQPSVTPEEEILNPICDAAFAQQVAAKLLTVR